MFCDSVHLCRLGAVEFEECVEQDVGAVGNVFGVGEFARGVADAADAWDEDHADWSKAGHILGVVTGSGGHELGCQAQVASGVGDYGTKLRIGRRRYIDVD